MFFIANNPFIKVRYNEMKVSLGPNSKLTSRVDLTTITSYKFNFIIELLAHKQYSIKGKKGKYKSEIYPNMLRIRIKAGTNSDNHYPTLFNIRPIRIRF